MPEEKGLPIDKDVKARQGIGKVPAKAAKPSKKSTKKKADK